ncbi:MAG: hypothetical protein J7L45_00400 [Candidatus Aenigmarchaeota archaeon]|nr:hypothetical protein [Candidatus Aenigmarchaeota archaeon]
MRIIREIPPPKIIIPEDEKVKKKITCEFYGTKYYQGKPNHYCTSHTPEGCSHYRIAMEKYIEESKLGMADEIHKERIRRRDSK